MRFVRTLVAAAALSAAAAGCARAGDITAPGSPPAARLDEGNDGILDTGTPPPPLPGDSSGTGVEVGHGAGDRGGFIGSGG
jgi:hypothetical protein